MLEALQEGQALRVQLHRHLEDVPQVKLIYCQHQGQTWYLPWSEKTRAPIGPGCLEGDMAKLADSLPTVDGKEFKADVATAVPFAEVAEGNRAGRGGVSLTEAEVVRVWCNGS